MIYWHIAPFAAAIKNGSAVVRRWHDPLVSQCEAYPELAQRKQFVVTRQFGRAWRTFMVLPPRPSSVEINPKRS